MNWIYLKNLVKLVIVSLIGRYFWNYRFYAKYKLDLNTRGDLKVKSKSKFAIVIQGPLIIDSNFTVNTLKLYRCNFPDAILILSSWHLSIDVINALKKYNVYIIQNTKPENPGISNINMQIVTSRAGVLAARDLGAQFVLKTRTDQRAYHPSMEYYLFCLVNVFPLTHKYTDQMNRLVAISLGTFKYRLYGVSDMFLYGHIDDMIRYFNIPLDSRIDSPEERKNAGDNTWRTFSTWRICEVYLCTEFLKSIGRDISLTLTDSFQVFRDHFVVIDQAAIKLLWHKYTLNVDRYADLGFFDPELSFNDWLVLYSSMDNLIVDENILDKPISKVQ
jgi:hypothetical protein